ncbi:hypothetical protein N0V93_009858 [Gnomoniopsis smithogilvyi]|uniref:S-adenosyl-L-methionine-dependent methyltransferase n=1 Tax=Gnomoniopsis smithogilvyi TaxID=1191159 RepID=A0A9W8YL90_9PEZI|nr:hypothetical protein N0V93_009858 [Gnomoniopsis smithogilvyi]
MYDQLAYFGSSDQPLQNVPFNPGTVYPPTSYAASLDGRPGLVFNGHVLEPSSKPIPEEFIRMQSGTSIAEPGSILDEESGRTYYNHSTGKYYLPNDAAEQDRLDLQHKVWLLYHWGELYKAPVVTPRKVLDIATGTGIWACQIARQHPEASVVGTDLSLIQPLNAPDNCSFIKEDSEHDEWIFPDPFDLIFMRMVVSCFDSHLTIFQKSFNSLEPGGWFEIHDATFELLCTDGSCTGSSLERWCHLMIQAAANIGRDLTAPRKYKQWMIETGFVDVVEDIGPMPGNPWPSDPRNQDLGRWNVTNLYRGIRGISWKLLRGLGMTPAEVEDLIEQVKFDITNVNLHFCFPFFTVYGRKPYPEEIAS